LIEVSLFQIATVFALLGVALAALFLMSRHLKSQSEDDNANLNAIAQLTVNLQSANERLERELRNAIHESARGGRQELVQTLGTFQQSLVQQSAEATRTQNSQMDAFAQQLALLQKTLSDTLTLQVQHKRGLRQKERRAA
jgi:DNA recombination protein RmuC